MTTKCTRDVIPNTPGSTLYPAKSAITSVQSQTSIDTIHAKEEIRTVVDIELADAYQHGEYNN